MSFDKFKNLDETNHFSNIPAEETVQETSLGYAGGKPNPLNPPYQGDFPLNSPLIRGARGVKNDERWVFCTVSEVKEPKKNDNWKFKKTSFQEYFSSQLLGKPRSNLFIEKVSAGQIIFSYIVESTNEVMKKAYQNGTPAE